MSFHSKSYDFRPADRLQNAPAVTAKLFKDILATSSRRLAAMKHTGKSARLGQLIEAGAWTDAALTLIELELPQWQIRRIAYDEGSWYCALSRQRELPEWLDQSVETHHSDLPLAILGAYVEAFSQLEALNEPTPALGIEMPTYPCEPLCCENFA